MSAFHKFQFSLKLFAASACIGASGSTFAVADAIRSPTGTSTPDPVVTYAVAPSPSNALAAQFTPTVSEDDDGNPLNGAAEARNCQLVRRLPNGTFTTATATLTISPNTQPTATCGIFTRQDPLNPDSDGVGGQNPTSCNPLTNSGQRTVTITGCPVGGEDLELRCDLYYQNALNPIGPAGRVDTHVRSRDTTGIRGNFRCPSQAVTFTASTAVATSPTYPASPAPRPLINATLAGGSLVIRATTSTGVPYTVQSVAKISGNATITVTTPLPVVDVPSSTGPGNGTTTVNFSCGLTDSSTTASLQVNLVAPGAGATINIPTVTCPEGAYNGPTFSTNVTTSGAIAGTGTSTSSRRTITMTEGLSTQLRALIAMPGTNVPTDAALIARAAARIKDCDIATGGGANGDALVTSNLGMNDQVIVNRAGVFVPAVEQDIINLSCPTDPDSTPDARDFECVTESAETDRVADGTVQYGPESTVFFRLACVDQNSNEPPAWTMPANGSPLVGPTASFNSTVRVFPPLPPQPTPPSFLANMGCVFNPAAASGVTGSVSTSSSTTNVVADSNPQFTLMLTGCPASQATPSNAGNLVCNGNIVDNTDPMNPVTTPTATFTYPVTCPAVSAIVEPPPSVTFNPLGAVTNRQATASLDAIGVGTGGASSGSATVTCVQTSPPGAGPQLSFSPLQTFVGGATNPSPQTQNLTISCPPLAADTAFSATCTAARQDSQGTPFASQSGNYNIACIAGGATQPQVVVSPNTNPLRVTPGAPAVAVPAIVFGGDASAPGNSAPGNIVSCSTGAANITISSSNTLPTPAFPISLPGVGANNSILVTTPGIRLSCAAQDLVVQDVTCLIDDALTIGSATRSQTFGVICETPIDPPRAPSLAVSQPFADVINITDASGFALSFSPFAGVVGSPMPQTDLSCVLNSTPSGAVVFTNGTSSTAYSAQFFADSIDPQALTMTCLGSGVATLDCSASFRDVPPAISGVGSGSWNVNCASSFPIPATNNKLLILLSIMVILLGMFAVRKPN